MHLSSRVVCGALIALMGCGTHGGTSAPSQPAPPVANAGGPYVGAIATAIAFSGAGSSDPQGQALSFSWNFGDGTTGTGVNPTHAYAAAGTYPVSLTVTDTSELSGTASTQAIIAAPQASLALTIVGLPNGASANVTVSGPNGYSLQVSSSQQLQVGAGAYTVTAGPTISGNSTYYSSVGSQSVTAAVSSPASVTVNYSTIIPNSTKVLDSVGMNSLVVSSGGSIISLSASSPVASSLAAGNVLASAPTPAAPNGILVKILSVSIANQIVTASVQQAALTDAIQQGTIQFNEVLGPSNTTAHSVSTGIVARTRSRVSPRTPSSGACAGNSNTIQSPFNVPLTAGLNLTGEDDVCPSFTFSIQIASFQVVSANVAVNVGLHAAIGLLASTQGTFTLQHTLATYSTAPSVVIVGVVPVVIQPAFAPYVGLSGTASASAYTGLTADSSLSVGTSYAGGAWTPVDTATSPATIGSATSVDGQVTLKAYAGMKASVSLYNVVGVTASLNGDGYLQFDSSLTANPCWSLTAGIEGSAGVDVTVLGNTLQSYSSPTLSLFSTPVLQATNTCFAPTLSSVTPNSGLQNGPSTTIALVGTNFVPDSVVNFNGQQLTTTFADPTDLGAALPASDLAVDGTFPVTVTSPDSPGGTSTPALPFSVTGVTVKVTPPTSSVPINKTQQFTATVTGTSNTSVIWTANGIIGGNSTIGTIDSNGLYTAPATVPNPATVSIVATSQAQPSASANATLTVTLGTYNFVLFSYPGAAGTGGSSINDNGVVVGTYSDGLGGYNGFLYSNGVLTPLNYPIPGAPTYTYETEPTGINNQGDIVGTYSSGGSHGGFLYSGGVFSDIKFPGGSQVISQTVPTAINNNGQIVGWYTNVGSSNIEHAFLDSQGTFTNIDYPGAVATVPSAINDNGQIVGFENDSSGNSSGFLYSGGTFTTPADEATGINNIGQMVGDYPFFGVYTNGSWGSFAGPASCPTPSPQSINNNGQITGYCYNNATATLSFVATPNP
jgi:probable HAF family extracellular repeat protein